MPACVLRTCCNSHNTCLTEVSYIAAAPRPRPAFDMRRHIKRARGGAEASQLQSHQDDAAAGAADNRQQREPHVARFMKRTRISPAEAVELLGALQL